MKIRYYISAILIIVLVVVLPFFLINTKVAVLTFLTNPRYELTAFFLLHDQKHESLIHVRGKLYAIISDSGDCKLIQKYEDKMIFNQFKISEANINQLNQYFKNAPVKQDLIHYRAARIYDGPILKFVYTNETKVKTLVFIAADDSIYHRVFEEIYSYTLKTKHNTLNDTIGIKEMRNKMLTTIRDEIEAEYKKDSNLKWVIQ
ncbi:MAG: hypothetical protein WCP85_15065 [Mariniphaga sp.]